MLIQAVESYIAVRRATGFAFRSEGSLLKSFAAFSEAAGKHSFARKPPSNGLDRRHCCLRALAGLAR